MDHNAAILMRTQMSKRRRQIQEALQALQAHEHRSYTTVVETHRDGTYYSARVESSHERERAEANAPLQDSLQLAEA